MASLWATRAGRYVLVCGLALLALGVGVAVKRHNDALQGLDARRAQYDAALRQASDQAPRFTLTQVRVPLSIVHNFSHGRYTTVKTEVARQIETGRPPLHPDFVALAGTGTDPIIARALRAGVRPPQVWVDALLVTQTTPGEVAHLRLQLERREVNHIIEESEAEFKPPISKVRREPVEWIPQPGKTAFVPLNLLYDLRDPNVHQYYEGRFGRVFITKYIIHIDDRLFVDRGNGRKVQVKIPKLNPLVLTTAPSP
jgi:hypothetical protein